MAASVCGPYNLTAMSFFVTSGISSYRCKARISEPAYGCCWAITVSRLVNYGHHRRLQWKLQTKVSCRHCVCSLHHSSDSCCVACVWSIRSEPEQWPICEELTSVICWGRVQTVTKRSFNLSSLCQWPVPCSTINPLLGKTTSWCCYSTSRCRPAVTAKYDHHYQSMYAYCSIDMQAFSCSSPACVPLQHPV